MPHASSSRCKKCSLLIVILAVRIQRAAFLIQLQVHQHNGCSKWEAARGGPCGPLDSDDKDRRFEVRIELEGEHLARINSATQLSSAWCSVGTRVCRVTEVTPDRDFGSWSGFKIFGNRSWPIGKLKKLNLRRARGVVGYHARLASSESLREGSGSIPDVSTCIFNLPGSRLPRGLPANEVGSTHLSPLIFGFTKIQKGGRLAAKSAQQPPRSIDVSQLCNGIYFKQNLYLRISRLSSPLIF
jgi:hypothetical protein